MNRSLALTGLLLGAQACGGQQNAEVLPAAPKVKVIQPDSISFDALARDRKTIQIQLAQCAHANSSTVCENDAKNCWVTAEYNESSRNDPNKLPKTDDREDQFWAKYGKNERRTLINKDMGELCGQDFLRIQPPCEEKALGIYGKDMYRMSPEQIATEYRRIAHTILTETAQCLAFTPTFHNFEKNLPPQASNPVTRLDNATYEQLANNGRTNVILVTNGCEISTRAFSEAAKLFPDVNFALLDIDTQEMREGSALKSIGKAYGIMAGNGLVFVLQNGEYKAWSHSYADGFMGAKDDVLPQVFRVLTENLVNLKKR